MSKKLLKSVLVVLLFAGLASLAVAQHEVDVRGNVPLYGQQQCVWCGAACGQMIMNGYPNPADRIFYSQLAVWNAIQANNSTDPADLAVNWATDPLGLRDTLRSLNPPPAGTWNIHADANRDTVMFDILYWMNRNSYPVATLINHGGHWVVIVRYVSDIEPVAGSNPTLQQITVYDPEPHNVGTQLTKTGAVWNATDWVGPVWYAGSWYNRYVAVVEPPVAKGTVKVEKVERIGTRIIRPEQAIEYARKWIAERKLDEKPPYRILQKKEIRALEPMLVREEMKPGLEKEIKVPQYYIVPFGFEREIGERARGLARVCVIVNAYTGQFEEIGAFGKPVRYLPREGAINVVAKALRLQREEMARLEATLMFQPSDITHIRVYPFWRIAVRNRVLYVDQLGKLYRKITRSVPGD